MSEPLLIVAALNGTRSTEDCPKVPLTPQDLAAAMGYDFEDVVRAIAMAQQTAQSYGVDLNAYLAPNQPQRTAAPAATPTEA